MSPRDLPGDGDHPAEGVPPADGAPPVDGAVPRHHEEALLAELRSALDLIEPVPGQVQAAARAAIHRRAPADALPIGLVRDSGLHDDPVAAGLRGGPRLLTFAATAPDGSLPAGTGPAEYGAHLVEIEVTGTGSARRIVGRLEPPGAAQLQVRHRDGDQFARVGPEGHFLLSGVPPGPISLLFRLPDASCVVTSWVRI